MKDGFIKVAAATPKIRVADPVYNTKKIMEKMEEAEKQRAVVVVFPELCITGYSCGDLFFMESLLEEAKQSLIEIAEGTAGKNMLVFVGLPVVYRGGLYNVAAALSDGKVLGLVPKQCIPGYNEFYETRHFAAGMQEPVEVILAEHIRVPMGGHLLFSPDSMPGLKVAAEICEDIWSPQPPSISHALAGANLIVNLSAKIGRAHV